MPRVTGAINDGEIVVASKEELQAAPLSGKRLLQLWNALPGVHVFVARQPSKHWRGSVDNLPIEVQIDTRTLRSVHIPYGRPARHFERLRRCPQIERRC